MALRLIEFEIIVSDQIRKFQIQRVWWESGKMEQLN